MLLAEVSVDVDMNILVVPFCSTEVVPSDSFEVCELVTVVSTAELDESVGVVTEE